MDQKETFTRYEIARIIGARALQIAMDAPLLLKISEEDLNAIKFDALKIARKEFESGVLPIAINRPTPSRRKEKLVKIKEEKISDAEIIAKKKEVEKEVAENLDEYSLVEEEERIEEMAEKTPKEQ
jgi:DNA-directed RNA polymerase subunit K